MRSDNSAVPGNNAMLLAAFLRALDAVNAAETAIDARGGGTKTTYQNLANARAALQTEIAALTVWDACGNPEVRP